MRKLVFTILLAAMTLGAAAQERRVQHKPYIDLRPMHFGISVGFHMQDIELQNVGPQLITDNDGTSRCRPSCATRTAGTRDSVSECWPICA